jgi:4-hydroxy-3-methylbut-2-enyl diphosphate reductase IspH
VYHVQTDTDVRPEWFDSATVVGLTAGTSTPDEVIDRVEARIRQIEARIRFRADASVSAQASADKSAKQAAGVAEGRR